MQVGSKVKWVTSNGTVGSGRIVEGAWTDTAVNHWKVAVDATPGDEHRLINCAETWLTEIK